MSWEQTVRDYFSKKPISFQMLLEAVEEAMDDPSSIEAGVALSSIARGDVEELPSPSSDPTPQGNKTLENVVRIVTDLGYNFKISRKNLVKILVPNEDRTVEMKKLRDIFEPLDFEYDPTRGGTHGMIKKLSRKEGSAFIVVKPEGSSGRAAQLGAEYEEELAKLISDRYSQYGITSKTAGFGHGSDLVVSGPNGTMTIEAKTSSGADFGQFRLVYSVAEERWIPAPTKSFKKNEALFTGLFREYLEEYLNQFASFPDISDDRVKAKKGFVTGLNPHIETGAYKLELQKTWFQERNDLIVPVDFESIAQYYEKKGDKFIQIGGRGLYAFDAADAENMGIPMFKALGKKASIRFRIKPEMGANGHHSFTVAVKLTIAKSNKDLTNEEDLDSIIEKLL